MKIIEILTFATSNGPEAYDSHPVSSDAVGDTSEWISNALTGPAFVIDPLRLRPEVPWPGASVRDTSAVPVASPTIGRDSLGSSDTSLQTERCSGGRPNLAAR